VTPEGKLKSDCRKIAKRNGLMFHNVEGKGVRGIPDTICEHVDGLGVVWCEFKRPPNGKDRGGVISEQQHERAAEIRRSGDRVAFPRSVAEWEEAVGLR
jgi:hypothetical protein